MSNDFYNHGSYPTPFSFGSSSGLRSELDSIAAGFDKLPALTGNAYKIPFINSAGTAVTVNSTLYTDSGGNLGIGTSSPGTRLEVSGSGNLVRFGDGTNTFDVRFKGPNNWDIQLDTSADKLKVRRNSTDFLTIESGGVLDVNADTVRVRTTKTPSSASASGTTGDICWDSNYVYVCVATNTWKRSALATW